MADNIALKDALGATLVARAKDGGSGVFFLMSLPMDALGNPNDATHPVFDQIIAGEAHIGEVGGRNVEVAATLAVTAGAAYASGNNVGGKLTLPSFARIAGGSGLIQSARAIVRQGSIVSPFDMVFFNADPAASTFTDKVAQVINTADVEKIAGVAHLSDVTAIGVGSIYQANGLAIPFDLTSGQSLYGALITRGVPTFTATGDVSVMVSGVLN